MVVIGIVLEVTMSEKDQSVNNTEEDFNVKLKTIRMIQILKTQYLTRIIVKLMLAIQKIIQKKVSRMKSQSLKILKLKIRKACK